MRVLLDQCTPAPLRGFLIHHTVETAHERGWSTHKNGALIALAESESFDVFVTTDKNLRYQQNLSERSLAIVVIETTSWPRIRRAVEQVVKAVDIATPGGYIEVKIP